MDALSPNVIINIKTTCDPDKWILLTHN